MGMLLGIDVGTSATKALLCDEAGAVLATLILVSRKRQPSNRQPTTPYSRIRPLSSILLKSMF